MGSAGKAWRWSPLAGSITYFAADAARAYGAGARHFATTAELVAALGERPAFASVLVKGSRFMKMEQVVAALQTIAAGEDTHAA